MSWNIGDKRNFFLVLKSKLGLYHVVLATPKTSPETSALTVVEMHQWSGIEKVIPRKKYLAENGQFTKAEKMYV